MHRLRELPRRALSLLAYQFYAKPRITRTDSVKMRGFDISVPPTVFHPALYFSTRLLASHAGRLDLASRRLLDMGCGSGLVSLVAASQGARVTAADINPVAVAATARNARVNSLADRIDVLESDLYESIPCEKFDYILFNPPFYTGIPVRNEDYAWQCGPGYETIRRFIRSTPQYLAPAGRLLMVLSTVMDLDAIVSFFGPDGLQPGVEKKERMFFEDFLILSGTFPPASRTPGHAAPRSENLLHPGA